MKIKKIALSLFAVLIVFGQSGNAQENNDSVSRYDVHTMPLTILDYTPRYRIGFEYHANNNLGYALGLGYGNSAISGFLNTGYIGDEYALFEIRPEFRYYFGPFLSDMYPYVSVEVFSIFMTNVFYDDYFHQEDAPLVTHYSRATMRKIKSGLHLKAGLKIYAVNKVSVNLYGGLGAAMRQIDYLNVRNPVEGIDDYWYEWFLPVYKFEGRTTVFHLAMGISFGYSWD